MGSPLEQAHITTPLRENAAVRRSKIDRLRAELGQNR
jgi:hypothetical protein